MKVSMDGLRTQAINAYNELTDALNDNMFNGTTPIRYTNIQSSMRVLRECLSTLAHSYQEGKEGWQPMTSVKFHKLEEANS